MDYSRLTDEDRLLIVSLTAELKRYNGRREADNKPDLVLSIQQAANLLGRSRQTVSRMIREGRLHKVVHMGISGILQSEITAAMRQ